jgi:hypothetical protein
MTPEAYNTFIRDNVEEIVKKVIELDNFGDCDIAILKTQIARGINIRKKMPVAPLDEIRELMVGYIAIRFIEEELGTVF